MSKLAKVQWNEPDGRYELRIMGQLKAYSQADQATREAHAEGKKELAKIANDKGYNVVIEENNL